MPYRIQKGATLSYNLLLEAYKDVFKEEDLKASNGKIDENYLHKLYAALHKLRCIDDELSDYSIWAPIWKYALLVSCFSWTCHKVRPAFFSLYFRETPYGETLFCGRRLRWRPSFVFVFILGPGCECTEIQN